MAAKKQTLELIQVAPADVVVKENIGDNRAADDELVGSVEAQGILQPLIAYRDPEGLVVLVAGHRRLDAARKLGLASVPVLVHPQEFERGQILAMQATENLARQDLTVAEEARVYDQLLLEFDEDSAAKLLARPVEQIRQGAAAARSKPTIALMRHGQLTLEQAAEVARINDSKFLGPQVKAAFFKELENAPEYSRHILSRFGGMEADARLAEERREELRAEGIRVVDECPEIAEDSLCVQLPYLLDVEGNKFTLDSHQSCPGHCAHVFKNSWQDHVTVIFGCDQWQGQGHVFEDDEKPARSHKVPVSPRAAAKAEARDEARAALQVKKDFIKEHFSQGGLPQGWELWLFDYLNRWDWRASGFSSLVEKPAEKLEKWVGADPTRALRAATHLILYSLVLQFFMDGDWWNSEVAKDSAIEVLRYLVSLGYEPSPLEARLLEGKPALEIDAKAEEGGA